MTGHTPEEALTDRGYRGKKRVGDMGISIPTSGTPGQSYYQKRKARNKFCKRAGIEPVIGHLKSDHRMMRNYLKGTLGDAINTLTTLARRLENAIFENENQYACEYSILAMVAK